MFPIPWNFPFKKKDGTLTTIDDAISSGGGGGYTLPTASADTKGGVKIGSGLTMTGEVLSATGGGSYTLPTASAETKGGIKIGSGLSMDGEVLNNSNPTPYILPTAAAATLGGVKVGSGLSIDENGVLSASGGGGGSIKTHVVKLTGTVGGSTSGTVTIYLHIVNSSSTAFTLATLKDYLAGPGADSPYPCDTDSYFTPSLGDKVAINTLCVNGIGALSINYYGTWINIGNMSGATVTDIVF